MADPGSVPPGVPRAAKRADIRRATLRLIIAVVALHSVALAVYYLTDMAHAASRIRMTFTLVWTFATALTVAVLLKRVRQARFGQTNR